MHIIELLAPARDLECGKTAILCGADAVYIGAPKFGARSAAGNSLDDIASLIEFAHRYWARVYVTVNILLDDQELKEAKELITRLYTLGADAIIIQDVGLLALDLPPVPLIASTQMHNHSLARISFLEKIGVKRAILARELSLTEIRAIARETSIELESFIHGALCVCYSGQCYLSYAIGGRSGNRGDCAQPCRKKYSLVDDYQTIAADLYLLSLKDLCLSGHLGELIDAGVTSFKIEGRLKDVNYVKNVVSFYRRELDRVLAETGGGKSSSGRSVADFTPDLHKTFNRSYSTYFLHGRGPDIASPQTPTMMGEYIGKAGVVRHDHFEMDNAAALHAGDGIAFFDAQKRMAGTNINSIQGNKVFPATLPEISPGTAIYRNLDHQFMKQLKNARVERTMALRLWLGQDGDEYVLRATDEDGVEAVVRWKAEGQAANDIEAVATTWRKQLAKWGGSEFRADSVVVELSAPSFATVREMNELRRRLGQEMLAARAKAYPREERVRKGDGISFPQQQLDFTANVCNASARDFYRQHGAQVNEPAAESGLAMRGRKVMTTKLCLRYQQGMCPKHHGKRPQHEQWYLVDEIGKKYPLRFDCAACAMEIYF